MVKITAIKTLQLDNVGDGCLVKIETDSGLVGYGESGVTPSMARTGIATIERDLIGQDPSAIERHFHMLSARQYSFIAHIPTITGIDIVLWDLAGKILGEPVYRLLGGPIREAVPIYSHGGPRNMLDASECRDWAQKAKASPEGFTAYKFSFPDSIGSSRSGPFFPTLDGSNLRRIAKGYANLRTALGDEIDIAMHCTGQFDTMSSVGLCRAIEPISPMWIEDPLPVHYSEAWVALKRSTRVPLLAGEKVEMVRGFRQFLDNQALDILHPDVAYSGGVTGCKKIADYAALSRTPVGLHSGPSSMARFYASAHLGAAMQNFFKVENVIGEHRGFKEEMVSGKKPVVRNSVFALPEGPGLGLQIDEDGLKKHLAKGEPYWA